MSVCPAKTQIRLGIRCSHETLGAELPIERTTMTQIGCPGWLGGCPGWTESSLGANSFCWFCYVVAHVTGLTVSCFFGKQLPIIGIYEPTPLYLLNLSFCITKILFPDYQASGRRLQHIFDAWMPTHVLHCCTYFCICIMFLSSGTDELDLSKLLRVQSWRIVPISNSYHGEELRPSLFSVFVKG